MQGSDSFRLIMRRGPQPNQTFDLNKDMITVGRDITNDIVINDPEVSRHHLRLARSASGYTIEDLGSTNGTFINGQRHQGTRPMNNGDMIGLGETVTLGYEAVRGMSAGAPEDGGAFQPTAPGAPPQPEPSPYQPPQPQPPEAYQPPQPEPSPYQPPAAASYNPEPAAPYAPQPPAYSQQPPQAPPGEYYEEYDDEPVQRSNTTRIVVIGCATFLVFCCCITLASAYFIDAQCLWWDLPVIGDVLNAVGQEPSMQFDACQQRYG